MDKQNTLLIVDDVRENIDALRGTLEEAYNIKIALNGQTALKILESANIDLMLLDVLMPDMDGFQVLEQMRKIERCKNIPVIFVTGALDEYSESRGLSLGAVDYVTKPYSSDIVSIKVRNQLTNKMYRDKLEQLVDMRTAQLLRSREALIMGMSLIAEGRDKETGEHIKGMQATTAKLAQKFRELYPDAITAEEVKRIILVSPLHDVGKVAISDTILLKPGKLTDEEFKIMQSHTILGANVLRESLEIMESDAEEIQTAIEISEGHHERFDGSGYPYKLKGEEIPVSARIVALADVYDALISIRAYKKAFTKEDACNVILEGDGRTMPSHFDPRMLEAFALIKDEL